MTAWVRTVKDKNTNDADSSLVWFLEESGSFLPVNYPDIPSASRKTIWKRQRLGTESDKGTEYFGPIKMRPSIYLY